MSRFPKQEARQSRLQARKAKRGHRENEVSVSKHTFVEEQGPAPVKASTKPLAPMNEKQALYGQAIGASRIIYGIGPAGTGKTWYAVALAVEKLLNGEIEKIYLTRPTEGTDGEKMGFLPGDLKEKYEPYLRPFRDAFIERLGTGHFEYLLRKEVIEAVPMAFLRGTTIKNAMMLADEMQNATKGQMKMLLTRIGKDSTFVLNGDPRQCDLARSSDSGLEYSIDKLVKHGVRDVSVIRFDRSDIVRDDIVQDIVEAFED